VHHGWRRRHDRRVDGERDDPDDDEPRPRLAMRARAPEREPVVQRVVHDPGHGEAGHRSCDRLDAAELDQQHQHRVLHRGGDGADPGEPEKLPRHGRT
jgi:hypothetical protein